VVKIKVFISYKWGDRDYANDLKSLLSNPNNKYRQVAIKERDDYRALGQTAIKNYLKGLIGECDALICLIGNDTHSSEWVKYELDVANSQVKKIIPVRIRGTSGGAPNIFKNKKILNWSAKEINDELSRR